MEQRKTHTEEDQGEARGAREEVRGEVRGARGARGEVRGARGGASKIIMKFPRRTIDRYAS